MSCPSQRESDGSRSERAVCFQSRAARWLVPGHYSIIDAFPVSLFFTAHNFYIKT